MTGGVSRLTWMPAFAAGAAGAAAAEMAVGLLLYVRGGFMGALTLVLCVEMAALAAGLWSAPRDSAPPWAGVRRAWFLLVLAHGAGAAVAASWEALGGLSSSWLYRGMGLAFLGAVPLYGTGLVLGASGSDGGNGRGPTGAAAAMGAAVGFAMVGLGRGSLLIAPFSYVAGVVVVSAGALVQNRILRARAVQWIDWAQQGSAGGGSLGFVPQQPAAPGAETLRAKQDPPPAPGTMR